MVLCRQNGNGKRKITQVEEIKGGLTQNKSKTSYQNTYTEVVKNKTVQGKVVEHSTVFVLNLPKEGTTKEIWHHFGRNYNIKDIILPKKRDINGNRVSFIQIESWRQMKEIIQEFNNTILI